MEPTQEYIESEQSLAVQLGEENTQELQNVVSRCLNSFYRRAYRQLGNSADAEDAVQEALLSAYKHLDQFKGQAQMSTWVTSIVTNSARMQLRRRPRQIHLSLDQPFGEEQEFSLAEVLAHSGRSPEEECREFELVTHVTELLAQLSPPLRKAFQLRDLEGLTTSQAADILGVADGTVKAQLARARAKLRKLMGRKSNEKPCSPARS